MTRPLVPLLLLLSSTSAAAADRAVGLASFDRVRIDGAFDVRIATNKPPRAMVSGDARALDMVELRVDGTTLHIRRRSDDTASIRRAATPIVVTLSAQTLTSAAVLGGGTLSITGMRTQRADLSVAGAGAITVSGVDALQANGTVIGGGSITLAGRATHVRLSTNGPGGIDAGALVADDLIVRLDGPGETKAQARSLASVTTTGLGRVVVTGNARCTVRAPAGGAVACGAP